MEIQDLPLEQKMLIEQAKAKKKKIKRLIVIILFIMVILVIGLASFILFKENESVPENKNPDKEVVEKEPVLVFLDKEIRLDLDDTINIFNLLEIENIDKSKIVFSSSNEDVVIIEGNNIVTVSYGIAIITASYDELETDLTIIISDNSKVYAIMILDGPYYLYIGEKVDIKYEFLPTDVFDLNFSWKSSSDMVAVNNKGTATGVKLGKATITLTNNNSACIKSEDPWCEPEVSTEVYVVENKISFEVLEEEEYKPVKEIGDNKGTAKITYKMRVKISGVSKPVYDPQRLTHDVRNMGGSSVVVSPNGKDESCADCYLYTFEYSFDSAKAGAANYSIVTFKLPNGSLGMLKLYTDLFN